MAALWVASFVLEGVCPPNALLASVADLLDPLFDHIIGCHPNRPERSR